MSASHAHDVLALEAARSKNRFPLVFPNAPIDPLIALRILWAAPWSLLGLLLGIVGLLSGGRVRREAQILEFWGGCLPAILRVFPFYFGSPVATFGHVVLGCSDRHLDACRKHQMVHVRQYERWGFLFVPVYLTCSLALRLCGKRPYYDNPFEREAFQKSAPPRGGSGLADLGITRASGDESAKVGKSEDGPAVLAARALSKTYGEGDLCVAALRGVDLSVKKGELLAIMGPSGSGKSTLLHLLGGVDVPTRGEVLLEGLGMGTLNDDQRTIIRRRKIGFIFQSFNLLPTLTALENVSLPLELDGVSGREADRRASAALELVGMTHRKTHLPGTLSGGEQQRVAIARALVIEPALVLADEPTGNLDSANGRQISALLRRLSSERQQTIVMVTHDQLVAAQADRIVCLRDGLVESDKGQVPAGHPRNGSAANRPLVHEERTR